MPFSKSPTKSGSKGSALFDGEHTTFYKGPEPGTLIQQFRDDWKPKGSDTSVMIHGKGAINNSLNEMLMLCLETIGLETNFVRRLNMREQLVQDLESLPLIVTMRNVAWGQFASDLGLPEGIHLPEPHLEFRYTSPQKPLVNESQILSFDWANRQELDQIGTIATRANDYLNGYFFAKGFSLIDFELRFARFIHEDFTEAQPQLIINSDLSLDALRLLDNKTADYYGHDDTQTDESVVSCKIQDLAKRLDLVPTQLSSNLNEEESS